MRDELIKAADVTLRECLNLRRHELIQIICDPPSFDVANAFYETAVPKCKESVLTVINARKDDDADLPEPVLDSLTKYDCVIIATSRQISQAGIKSKLAQSGVRIAALPGITPEIFCRTALVDWRKLGAYTRRVAAQLSAARSIKITSSLGTDLLLQKGDTKAISDDGRLSSPGTFGNIPAGEVYLSPFEGNSEGVIYIDGSFSLCPGVLQKPLIIEMKNGLVKKVYDHPCAGQLEKQFSLYRQTTRTISEFGVGTLETAVVSGNSIEDKKTMGALHITLGTGGGPKIGFSAIGVLLRTNVALDDKLWIKDGAIL